MIKDIIITNRCQVLTSRGMCTGPITVPFKEDTAYIFRMVCDQSASIHEVLRDGTSIRLDVFNYDKDNQPKVEKKEEVKSQNPARVDVIKDIVVKTEEVIPEVVEEEVPVVEEQTTVMMDGEEVVDESAQQPRQNKQNNNYKKNKNKK